MVRIALLSLLCGLLAVAVPGVAQAARSRVVVLHPAVAGGAVPEAVTRTRAELAAEGFEVVSTPLPRGADLRRTLVAAAARHEALAAVAIFGLDGNAAADLWVTDRTTGKTVIRSVRVAQLPAAERPRALAIRAVELLRASLVEAVAPATREHQQLGALPADAERWLSPAAGPLAGLSAQLSLALLTSFDGIGPAGAPQLRLALGTDGGWTGRVTFLGPALGARPSGPQGSARVRQELATLELAYAPPVDWAGWTPVLWVGAGPYHLHATGELLPGHQGTSDDVWAAALLAGAGVGYRFTDEVAALADVAALLTSPRAEVTLFGDVIGRAGRPSLQSSLGVVVRF